VIQTTAPSQLLTVLRAAISLSLGHKDGGVLAMKTHGHLWGKHEAAMAEKGSF
jgi:hypothetical protein